MATASCASTSVPTSPRSYGNYRPPTLLDLRNGVSPLNSSLTPRDVSMSPRAIEVRQQWFQGQQMEKMEVASELEDFDDRLQQMHVRTPRLNQSWRSHIPLTLPRDDYKPAAVHVQHGPADSELEEAFKLIDKSGDGSISFTEFIKGMRSDAKVAALVQGDKIQDAFRRMDTDGSMKVDLDEFKTFIRKLHGIDGKRIVLTPRG